jgi:hypothetical protein
MDMKIDDDQLLKQFMDANRQEVADGGFSRRVMRSLPARHNRAMHLLNTLCAIVSVFLFLAFDGIQAIVEVLRNIFVYSMQHIELIHVDLKTVIVLFCLLLFFSVRLAWQHVDE